MGKKKMSGLSSTSNSDAIGTSPEDPDSCSKDNKQSEPTKIVPWHIFLQGAQDNDIRDRFNSDITKLLQQQEELNRYCCLALLEPEDSISTYELDQIYRALVELDPNHDRDILLMLLSRGGSIEPAYQISKLCKSFSKSRFVVAVPRQAKSAATLIALGADEIHIGPLGQLGPIDPQLGGLPALGVTQALETIASLSEKHPGSADMFARYLRMALTVEQIGYCDRISESAIQYAVRLLSTKPFLADRIPKIAKELVHEYKDHGFVIDLIEAQQHLGSDWVKTDTSELKMAESIYNLFDKVNLFLGVYQSKRMLVLGSVSNGVSIFSNQRS